MLNDVIVPAGVEVVMHKLLATGYAAQLVETSKHCLTNDLDLSSFRCNNLNQRAMTNSLSVHDPAADLINMGYQVHSQKVGQYWYQVAYLPEEVVATNDEMALMMAGVGIQGMNDKVYMGDGVYLSAAEFGDIF